MFSSMGAVSDAVCAKPAVSLAAAVDVSSAALEVTSSLAKRRWKCDRGSLDWKAGVLYVMLRAAGLTKRVFEGALRARAAVRRRRYLHRQLLSGALHGRNWGAYMMEECEEFGCFRERSVVRETETLKDL
jgi:hypothetical protein